MHEEISSLKLSDEMENRGLDHRQRRELFERQISPMSTSSTTSTEEHSDAVVDLQNLRALAFSTGLPERHRAVGWKLLLGYLPPRRSEWSGTLEEKRAQYAKFAADFVVAAPEASSPEASTSGGGGGDCGATGGRREEEEDHPLSQAASSSWGAFFRDADLIGQISRDVARTHPGMHFFGEGGGGSGRCHGRRRDGTSTRRGEMARALLVFAKLNPGLAYVQGMNELLAPLYYHCALEEEEEEEGEERAKGEREQREEKQGDVDVVGQGRRREEEERQHLSLVPSPTSHPPSAAESDAFWCLVSLMADFRDNFCSALDRSDAGVAGSLARVEGALRSADAELAAHVLDANGVSPHFFAFRWVSLLLTQEFELPDVARLWDYLFAVSGSEGEDENGVAAGGDGSCLATSLSSSSLTRPEALARLCAAMVVRAREPLLRGDFASNLKLLQRYPPEFADVRGLLELADSLPPRTGRDRGSKDADEEASGNLGSGENQGTSS